MLGAIRKFVTSKIRPDAQSSGQREHGLYLATAALLIEVSRMDDHISEEERRAVTEIVQSLFSLAEAEIDELIQLAEEEVADAHDYHQFTSLINQRFTPEEKITVVEHLWQVAFADQRLHEHEEYLIRKIADLIGVEHRDFIAAKHRARHAAEG